MGNNVTPIASGVIPEIDVEREMIAYIAEQIRDYREAYGISPDSIAVVLIGEDHGDAVTRVHSWSPRNEEKSRLHCCAVASAMLMKRALGIE